MSLQLLFRDTKYHIHLQHMPGVNPIKQRWLLNGNPGSGNNFTSKPSFPIVGQVYILHKLCSSDGMLDFICPKMKSTNVEDFDLAASPLSMLTLEHTLHLLQMQSAAHTGFKWEQLWELAAPRYIFVYYLHSHLKISIIFRFFSSLFYLTARSYV